MTGISVLYSADEIGRRVDELAAAISEDFAGERISVVGLLEDSFVFMADLIRKLDGEVLCYFMKADVAEQEDTVSDIKRILYYPELEVRGENVLLLGGVLDTGITLDYVTKHILQGGPRLLKIGYLIDKPLSRRVSINADYAGFVPDSAESSYLVGYGLGRANSFRHLSYLGILEKDART